MVAEIGCAPNTIGIIQVLGPSVTLSTATVAVAGSTTQSSTNLTWTPKLSQYGPNLLCGIATDNTYLISNLNCYTILAGVTVPYIIPGSRSSSDVFTRFYSILKDDIH